MNLLADECVDQQIVDRLRKDGHNVLYILEMTPGISDEVVLARTNQEKRVLLTMDKDFGELIFRQIRIFSGVVLIRLAGFSQKEKAKLVSSVIKNYANRLYESFTVISKSIVRIRKRVSWT